jgi:4-amino-4-deoxy-L-arabinose transferase-like glycosyltransferase
MGVRRWDRSTRLILVIGLFALALRLMYIAGVRDRVGGDGRYYHAIAALVVDGRGFIDPGPYLLHGLVVPSAPHPPAWPLLLSGAAFFGFRTVLEQQVIACLIGAATVIVVGFAGRRIAGATSGLVAAAIAAVYPNFWLYERELMSESLTLFGAALVLLLSYRYRARPSLARALAVGIACGLLAVTHAEQLLLLAVLLVPLIMLTPDVSRRRRVGWTVSGVAVATAFVLPWAAYNTARFDRPVLLGTEFGVTVAISNCRTTYHGSEIGFQDATCKAVVRSDGPTQNQAATDARFLTAGVDYARNHLSRLPLVVAAREARTWSLLPDQIGRDKGRGTRLWVIELGFVTYWALIPFAIAGIVILRRRHVPTFPLLTMAVTVSIATAVTYGFTRFRAAAEVPIVLLAATSIDVLIRSLLGRGVEDKGVGRTRFPPPI